METKAKPSGRPLAPVKAKNPCRLREFRLRFGYSQQELANLIGASQATLSEAERRGTGLGDDKWNKLAAIFKSDVLTLRGWVKIYQKI